MKSEKQYSLVEGNNRFDIIGTLNPLCVPGRAVISNCDKKYLVMELKSGDYEVLNTFGNFSNSSEELSKNSKLEFSKTSEELSKGVDLLKILKKNL